MAIKRYITFLIILLAPCIAKAQEDFSYSDDFVTSSLLLAEPGGVLYSRVGHIAIRMQCPSYNLDYVFSYESEDVRRKVLSFLSGSLRMGLFAVPTSEYLEDFSREGRGVSEYTLNLPIESKRNLWQVLDKHVMEGIDLPYDYLSRGCAHSALSMIKEGIAPLKLEYGSWPDYFSMTRREITSLQMKKYPWTWCFLNLICNGSIDQSCTKEEKIIMPTDLIKVLSDTKVNGTAILSEPVEVLPSNYKLWTPWFSPLYLTLILLLLTVVLGLNGKSYMDYILLVIQTILGLISLYLVCFSTLVCTEWSWLIIPFNPLPAIFWKWRKKWSLPYAAVCTIWAAAMGLSRHELTDSTYIVLSISLAISYIFTFLRQKRSTQLPDTK